MTLQQRLTNNRRALGIPDPELLPLTQLESSEVANSLTAAMLLLDALEHLSRCSCSSNSELVAIRKLAGSLEHAIAKAVLTPKTNPTTTVKAHDPTT